MSEEFQTFDLTPDQKGLWWDLLLYVPTVIALASMALWQWYDGGHNTAWLLYFLASFFFIAGANRILKMRLMLLPSAPVRIALNRQTIRLTQRNQATIDLIREQKFYADYAGKSFGISGLNGKGERLQFVFGKGQFAQTAQYDKLVETLKRYFKA